MKVLMLQIPTSVIRGEDVKLDALSFVVYAYILRDKFKNFNVDTFPVSLGDMRDTLAVKDNRTIKNSIIKLNKYNMISGVPDKINFKSKIYINIADLKRRKFTQLPIQLLEKVSHIGAEGFRLLYYYESYINRKESWKLYAYPSYKKIAEDLKIGFETISKYNDILVKNKMIKIEKFETDITVEGIVKYNNHYSIRLDKMY